MITCILCKNDLEDGMSYCDKCYRRLDDMSTISKTHCIECECIIEDGHLYCIHCDPEEYEEDMGPQDVVVEVEEPIIESIEIKEITRLLKENEDLKLLLNQNRIVNNFDASKMTELELLRSTVLDLNNALKTAEDGLRERDRLRSEATHKSGQIQAYIDIVDVLTKKLIEASDHDY